MPGGRKNLPLIQYELYHSMQSISGEATLREALRLTPRRNAVVSKLSERRLARTGCRGKWGLALALEPQFISTLVSFGHRPKGFSRPFNYRSSVKSLTCRKTRRTLNTATCLTNLFNCLKEMGAGAQVPHPSSHSIHDH